MKRITLALIFCGIALPAFGQVAKTPGRLEVLFLGDDRGHQPIERYRVLKQALGPRGVNLTYVEDLGSITKETLELQDALIVYANHEQDKVPEAILPWVKSGGALVALHSACGNFHPSKEWFDLVGGRFQSHEGHEFSPINVDQKHAITADLPELKCWDETYVHTDLTDDRHLLQERPPLNAGESEPEPWTWTRDEGDGRVFYTASGHDLRCWNLPAYQELVYRGILWSVGEQRAKQFLAVEIPKLEMEKPRISNRAHPEIPMMELQKPLSAEDSAKHAQVPAGTKLELFASEPMVVNPIAIDWDEKGRAWVVESFGYPNDVPMEVGKGKDRIKILEDTNFDGKADKVTMFADGLRHCTTTVFYDGGIIATDGPDIVFLKDDNGDGWAEEHKRLASGLNMSDTHAATSHFLYGLDNWIYATVGYSGVDIKVGDETHKFGNAVFRFRPDLSKLEHLQSTSNNTWGLGFTEDGDVIGSTANNNPSWMVSIPNSAYKGTGVEQPQTPRIETSTLIYPNTFDITQVDQINRFTAGAGHQFYTDDLLSAELKPEDAFICEPTGHLVAMGNVRDNGSLKTTVMRGNNLFASSDAWCAPVAARPGPDGAMWIADWYDPIIQHNVVFRFWNPARGYDQPHSPFQTGDPGPGKGNAYVTPLRDSEHGRIWRIVPADGEARKPLVVDIDKPSSLIAGLKSPSQSVRLHAQRLLIQRGKLDAVVPLSALIEESAPAEGSDKPLAAVHAIWALEGLGLQTGSPAYQAVASVIAAPDTHPLLRRHALAALGADDPAVVQLLPELLSRAASPRNLLLSLIACAETSPNDGVSKAVWKLANRNAALDDTQREAIRLAMIRQGFSMLAVAISDLGDQMPDGWQGKALIEVAERIAASPNKPALVALLEKAPDSVRQKFAPALEKAGSAAEQPEELPEHLIAGRDAYMRACIECHQVNGMGMEGTFPPLKGSEWVKGNPRTILRIMLGGLSGPIEVKGEKFESVMPGHSHIEDEEIAAIASYVRYAFGDMREKPFPPAEVKALRPEVEKRMFAPWTVKELKELER